MIDSNKPGNVGLLMHVPLQVTAELGSCRLSVAEVLELGTGSIVELDRVAGGPVDLLANGKPIARGEIVAAGEHFGVRVTELIERPL